MEKQRYLKMGILEQNFLVKALLNAKMDVEEDISAKVQVLIEKTVRAPKRRLYLTDEEYEWAARSLNIMRNSYLSAGRSSGGIDRVLLKLMNSKYKRVPNR